MKQRARIGFLLCSTLFLKLHGLKIFEFSSSLDNNSRVMIVNDAPTPEEFSLCLDFYSRFDTDRRLLGSKEEDIEIRVSESAYRFYIRVTGIWYLVIPEDPAWVDTVTWQSICVSYNSRDQAVTVAFRNRIIFTEKQEYPNRKLSGTFLKELALGEKDSDFEFIGDITRVNIWSKVLDEETLKNITNCGSSYYSDVPDLLNWDNVEVTVQGDIILKNVEDYPCNSASNNVHDVLMPISSETMFEALKTCKILGGKLNFPFTEEEVDPFIENAKSKLSQSECKSYVWSNYYKNSYADNNWTVYESESTYLYPPFQYPGWLEYAVGQPNGRDYESCAGISLDTDKPNLVHDLDCYKKDYCYSCRFEKITYFFMRGVCEELDKILDYGYLADMDTIKRNIDKGIELIGYTKTKIVLDKKSNRWGVISLKDGSTLLSLDSEVRLPTGPLRWNIPPNICGDDKSERKLFLTSCNGTEFACYDSQCISIEKRCDGSKDCSDFSDELNCKTLYWTNKEAYSNEIPPPPSKEEDAANKTKVVISATILNILELKELEGVWQPKVIFQMEWFDSRLSMQNLKDDIQLNVLANEERHDPWLPIVIFINNKESKRFVLDKKASLVVRKEGNGTANTAKDLDAAEVYYGDENPFLYGRTYSMELECDFNLRSYPFDTQECFIELGVPFALKTKVELEAYKIYFNGSTDLPQFEVQSSFVVTEAENAYFIVKLKRKFAYHLVSVYIPSLSLLAVSLATMHISIDHFEANIMVHLTAMLVMYTLFQAISISLPKTAYIKFMDAWLLFGLVLPFVGFVLSITEELVHEDEDENRSTSANHQKRSSRTSPVVPENGMVTEKPRKMSKQRMVQIAGRVFLPSLTISFVFIYFIAAIYLYNNPNLKY